MTITNPRITELKAQKAELQLELKGITLQMSAIRSDYSERQSNIFFKPSRHHKDAKLRPLEQQKQKLQQQILAVSQAIAGA